MTHKALGMIETYGMTAAIEAADVALKTAAVELVNYEIVKSGRIMVALYGEVAAVQAAVSAGAAAAAKINMVFSQHVIPRPLADPRLLINRRDEDSPQPPEDNNPGQKENPLAPGENPPGYKESAAERQQLEAISVPKLRDLARKTEGIAIKGRQISKANKEQLIEEIIKARKNNN